LHDYFFIFCLFALISIFWVHFKGGALGGGGGLNLSRKLRRLLIEEIVKGLTLRDSILFWDLYTPCLISDSEGFDVGSLNESGKSVAFKRYDNLPLVGFVSYFIFFYNCTTESLLKFCLLETFTLC
jgi:hypothetical protein